MPSLVTHAYFALDVLEKLDENTKNIINKELDTYKVFSNGPDPFFSAIGKNKNIYRKFGHTMHREKCGLFFKNVITYIKENNLENNPQVLAYLYGNITHYVLDSTIHPLVYYKTGRYIKGRKDRKIYKGKHGLMEFVIDQYMLAVKNNTKNNKVKIHNLGIPKIKLSNGLINLIEKSSLDTYDIKNAGIAMKRSIKSMRFIYKHLRYDRFGIKRLLYNFLYYITFKKLDILVVSSYKFNFIKYIHYLNLDKNEWFHPVDKEEIFNYSYIELYAIAYKRAIKLINLVNQVLNNEIEIENVYDLLNNSYLTGKNLEDRRKIQYFSY